MITTSSSHLDWMLDYTAIGAGLVNRRQADRGLVWNTGRFMRYRVDVQHDFA